MSSLKICGIAVIIFTGLFWLSAGAFAGEGCKRPCSGKSCQWTCEFITEDAEFVSAGSNPYFILQPGYRLVFEEEDKKGGEKLIITVLDETKKVGNVETRVVEEREFEGGELKEISLNYFAISKKTNGVFYFGEAVDIYKEGKVVKHEGAWLSGENNAKFGLMMPGIVLLGAKYYQEIAPKIAMDRAEVKAMGLTVKTKAGEFNDCVKMEETNPLEAGEKEYKVYAPGVGLIIDGALSLVEYGYSEEK